MSVLQPYTNCWSFPIWVRRGHQMEAELSGITLMISFGFDLICGVCSRWVGCGWLTWGACAPQVPLHLIDGLTKVHMSHCGDKGTQNRHSVISTSSYWSANHSAKPKFQRQGDVLCFLRGRNCKIPWQKA